MKSLLLVCLGLMPLLVNGQAIKLTRIDSLIKQQAILDKRLDSLSIRMRRLSVTNDSLNKELYYYRAKDDFYVMAVDRQGSHFEWLLGSALAVVAFFSYAYFRDEIKKLRLEFSSTVINYEKNVDKINYRLYKQSAHSLGTTSALIQGFTALVGAFGSEKQPNWITLPFEIRRLSDELSAYLICSEEEKELEEQEISACIKDVNKLLDAFFSGGEIIVSAEKIQEEFDSKDKVAMGNLNKIMINIEQIPRRNEIIEIVSKVNKILAVL